jgi:uroporphyrinogen decarboxylase
LENNNILRAARGENVSRIPVWIMRQAGRYLPEFREIRTKQSFFDLVQNPKLACEVTLMVKRASMDLFAIKINSNNLFE